MFRLKIITDASTQEIAVSLPEKCTLAVTIPNGLDWAVERSFPAQHGDSQLLLDAQTFNSEPNIVVDCEVGEGDLGGLGKIGGLGERKDREEKGGRKEERAELVLSTVEFPIQGGNTWRAGDTLVEDLVFAYGYSAVQRCFARAKTWLACNPEKLKTSRGMPKFLNRWLANENRPIQQNTTSLTKDVNSTAKIIKGRPTIQGW